MFNYVNLIGYLRDRRAAVAYNLVPQRGLRPYGGRFDPASASPSASMARLSFSQFAAKFEKL